MRITYLKIHNFRGVHYEGLIDEGSLILTGMNGSGKSTIIDAIYLLLGRQVNQIDETFAQGVTAASAEFAIKIELSDADKEYIAQSIRRSQGERSATLEEVRQSVQVAFPGNIFERTLVIKKPRISWSAHVDVKQYFGESEGPNGAAEAALRHLVIRTDRLNNLSVGRIFSLSAQTNLADIAAAQIDTANRQNTTNFDFSSLFIGRINSEVAKLTQDGGKNLKNVIDELATYFNDALAPFSLGMDEEAYKSSGVIELRLKSPFGELYPLSFASSGQKQALALLCLTKNWSESTGKPILLMDEPDAGMHPDMISKVFQVIGEELDRQSATCIIATHSPDLVKSFGQNVFRLERTSSKVELTKVDNLEHRLQVLAELGFQFDMAYLVKRIIFTEGELDSKKTLRDDKIYQMLVDPLIEKVLFRSGPSKLGSKKETGNRAKVYDDIVKAIVGENEFKAWTLTDRDLDPIPKAAPNVTTPYRNIEYLFLVSADNLSAMLLDDFGIKFDAKDIDEFCAKVDAEYTSNLMNANAKKIWRELRTNLVHKGFETARFEELEKNIIVAHVKDGLASLPDEVKKFLKSLKDNT